MVGVECAQRRYRVYEVLISIDQRQLIAPVQLVVVSHLCRELVAVDQASGRDQRHDSARRRRTAILRRRTEGRRLLLAYARRLTAEGLGRTTAQRVIGEI